MKIDILANEIKRIADALESIVKFQELELGNNQKKFDFTSGSFFSWSDLNNTFKVIEHSFEEDLELLFGIDEAKITDESSFIDDLGADSLDTVELVMAFEEEFGSEISDSEAEKILTVGDAVKFIEGKAN